MNQYNINKVSENYLNALLLLAKCQARLGEWSAAAENLQQLLETSHAISRESVQTTIIIKDAQATLANVQRHLG